jgi:uncharacterized protein YndB with AHSA1/START domain
MAFDLARHVGAVTRGVVNCERDGLPAKTVVATVRYPTDAADLWDAVTNAERIPRWFLPISGDLRLGGRYQFQGNAGGTITRCDPPQRLEATWEMGGFVSWVAVTLTPAEDGTDLTLEHTAHLSPHWDQFGPGAVGVGWDMGLMGLGRHIDSGAQVEIDENTWVASPEGGGFVRFVSDDWGCAAIDAGEDPEKALASAEATRKFYTGEA